MITVRVMDGNTQNGHQHLLGLHYSRFPNMFSHQIHHLLDGKLNFYSPTETKHN